MTKRVFAFLLCLVMCLSLIPAAAFADAGVPPLEGEVAAEQPEGTDAEEPETEEPLSPGEAGTAPLAGEPTEEPPLEGEAAAEQPEGSDAEEPETEEPLSPGEAETAPLAGEPEEEPPLEGEAAAEQPEGSDAEEPETEEPLSPGEAETAPPAEEPEEDFEDPFLPVDDDNVKDEAADYNADPADGKPQTVNGNLGLGARISVAISKAGGVVYYRFHPYAADTYTLTSSVGSGAGDPVCVLYDENWKRLFINDDGAGDGKGNFVLPYELEADKDYYYCIFFYSASSTGSVPVTMTKQKTGWQKQGSDWYYFNEDSSPANGLKTIKGKTYGFNYTGLMVVNGVVGSGGNGYLTGSDGIVITTTGWQKISVTEDGKTRTVWYYVEDSTGRLAEDWKKIGGTWYYFCPYMLADGCFEIYSDQLDAFLLYFFNSAGGWENAQGWKKDSRGLWYYVDNTGHCVSGLQTIKGKQYYFDDLTGAMLTDAIRKIGGKTYRFGSDGAAVTDGWFKEVYTYPNGETYTYWYYLKDGEPIKGWKKIDGKWYYFAAGSGSMLSSATTGMPYEIDGKKYFFTSSGALAGAGWQKQTLTVSDKKTLTFWFYTDANGVVTEGWKKIDGKWYYFEPGYGAMISSALADMPYEIDGKLYYFSASGAMQTGWIKVTKSQPTTVGTEITWTVWYYANGSGVVQTGWQTIDGKKYYLNPEMCANDYGKIDGKYYLFTASGALAGAGWQKLVLSGNTVWFYCNADGTCVGGWKKINGSWYFFDPDMLSGGLFWIDGKWEFFKSSGAWVATNDSSAWRRDGQDLKYYENGEPFTGWKKIEGEWYFFDRTDGKLQKGWTTDGGKRYYCSPEMLHDRQMQDGGNYYYLGSDGAVVTKVGWLKKSVTREDGSTDIYWKYVEDSTGKLADGWRTIGGKTYYFYECSMYANGTYRISGTYYKFDKSGACLGEV